MPILQYLEDIEVDVHPTLGVVIDAANGVDIQQVGNLVSGDT